MTLHNVASFCIQCNLVFTIHGNILVGENLANHELFIKIFLANNHRYTTNVFGIYTDCSSYGSLKFPLPIEVFPVAMVVLDVKHLK